MTARSPAEEEAWRYIVFRLENDPGFWFGLIAGDDRRPRRRLRDRAEAWCKANGVAFHEHTRAPGELRMIAVELSHNPQTGLHWIHADGLEALAAEWDAGAKAMLMAMNERRDAYRRHLMAGVVVDGRLSLKPILRDFAPDMFSIRAFVAEPGADPSDPLPVLIRPEGYFHLPMQETHESAASLLARAERLSAIEDRDAARLRRKALAAAIAKLQSEGRWREAQATAERLAKEPFDDVNASGKRALTLFVRAAELQLSVPVAEPGALLSRIRAEMAEASALAEEDAKGPASIPFAVLMLAELNVLRRLRRFGEARATLERLARLAAASDPAEPYSPITAVLPAMFPTSYSMALEMRAEGDLEGAVATADVILGLVEEAHRRSPDDPRWELERGRALLLHVENHHARGDFSSALATSSAVISLAENHGEADSPSWRVLRQSACTGRLIVLALLRDWKAVADGASAALEEQTFDDPDLWYRAAVAVLRAEAARKGGASLTLGGAVDDALNALALAIARGGTNGFTLIASQWIPRLTEAVVSSLELDAIGERESELSASSRERLRSALQIAAVLFVRWPTPESRRNVMVLLLAASYARRVPPGFQEAPRRTRRSERRLRRRARVLRRWRDGKRLPPFVLRWIRELAAAAGKRASPRASAALFPYDDPGGDDVGLASSTYCFTRGCTSYQNSPLR